MTGRLDQCHRGKHMEEFISWLWNLSYWHWFGLGVLFLTFEIILPTNVLVFPAISAILLGGLITLYPDLDWRLQVLYFALLSLASAIAWRWWFKTRDRAVDHPHLNARGAALIGRKIVLEDTLHLGRGRVKIEDNASGSGLLREKVDERHPQGWQVGLLCHLHQR